MNEDKFRIYLQQVINQRGNNFTTNKINEFIEDLKEKIPNKIGDNNSLLDITNIDKLNLIKDKLNDINDSLNGFNIQEGNGRPSNAIYQYINFLKEVNLDTDKEVTQKIIMNTQQDKKYDDLIEILFDKDSITYHVLHTQTMQKFKIIKSIHNNIVAIPFTDIATLMTISKDEINKTLNGNGNFEPYSKIIIDYLNGEKNINDIEQNNINNKDSNRKEEIYLKFSNEVKGNLDFPHQNILFKGVPGTGKSKTVDNIIKDKLDMKELSDNVLRINIHSASSNSDLMQGISISTDEKQNILYKEKRGSVLKHIVKAIYRPFQPFVLVLEEIQENSLNELIGDLIYLIEDTKRTKVELDEQSISYTELIKLLNPEHFVELPSLVENSDTNTKMIIPDNLYIFCTSNYRDDKKVIEDNLLRRFDVIEMYPKNREDLGQENGEFIFKSKEVSDFLEKLNTQILKQFKDETHPDRNIIGHANWLNITDEDSEENKQLFYKALLKVIIEFKEIREVEFASYAQPIFSEVFKKENGLSQTIEKYLEIFYTDDILTLSTYKDIVDKLQQEIYSSFI